MFDENKCIFNTNFPSGPGPRGWVPTVRRCERTVRAKNGVLNQDELAPENENLDFPTKNKILNFHGASDKK